MVEALQTHTHTSTLISTIRHLHKTKKSTRYDIYESPHLYHVPNDNHLIRRIIIIILWIFHFILLFFRKQPREEKKVVVLFLMKWAHRVLVCRKCDAICLHSVGWLFFFSLRVFHFFLRCSWHIITRISVQANLTSVSNNRKVFFFRFTKERKRNIHTNNEPMTTAKTKATESRQCVCI